MAASITGISTCSSPRAPTGSTSATSRRRGKFYVLARSNVVTTPRAGVTDALDENWANVQKQFERIQNPSSNGNGNGTTHHNTQIDLRDLFEERLRRPMSSATLQNLATTALPHLGRDFHFQIDAELIVYGTTEPNARVTLQGSPSAPRRRNVHRPVQPAGFAPDHPGGRLQRRRQRGADDRAGRGTQHQGTRADDPRQQRNLSRSSRSAVQSIPTRSETRVLGFVSISTPPAFIL